MPSFLRMTLDHALAILNRERPFFSFGSLSMYTLALIAETPVILARYFLTALITLIVLTIEGNPEGGPGWAKVALIPTVWSIIALVTPIGSAWWWRTRAGGRNPSMRELLAYQDAVELLQSHSDKPLPLPKRWFVLDTPQPDAAVCGNTLMLSRGLLETDHVPAVLAHELGHLGTPDGRLTAAINRLVIFSLPFGTRTGDDGEQDQSRQHQRPRFHYTPREPTNALDLEPALMQTLYGFLRFLFITSLIAKGGFGLWLTGPIWGRYWRRREYKADEYAASLGQADELADFLEVHALIHDHPVPFIWLTEHTHPPTELRIDKLRNTAPHDQTPAQDEPSPATPDTRPLTT
jgi:Zn-dependent protease with chaperone function